MTTEYSNIYSCFLSRITDPEFAQYDEETQIQLMDSWLHRGLGNPRIRHLFKKITLLDEVSELYYELKDNRDEDEDRFFVEELFGLSMYIAWLEPIVNNTSTLQQMYSNKEQKFYSQSNHLSEVSKLLQNAKIELVKMIRDRTYIHNEYVKEYE